MVLTLATATVSFTVYGPLLMTRLFDVEPAHGGLHDRDGVDRLDARRPRLRARHARAGAGAHPQSARCSSPRGSWRSR